MNRPNELPIMSTQHPDEMAPWGNAEYRAPKALRFELVQHIGIFFEEKLYTQALSFLFNTLASGSYASPECTIPLPPHLAIAATFLVHPSTTERATSSEEKEVAHIALRLLRLLGSLVSPRQAKLDIAFAFTNGQSLRSGGKFHPGEGNRGDRGLDENKPLNIKLGQEGSLWSRAEDFWHAVGWSFNCSAGHPERWERWQIWLEYMCDVLQDDWNERERIFKERQKDTGEPSSGTNPHVPQKRGSLTHYQDHSLTILKESLIYQYISAGNGFGKHRRMIRAIFADGSSNSMNEFRQVFPKELKPVKSDRKSEKAKKRERDVDIDKEEYGDYLAQDESDDDATAAFDPEKSNLLSASTPGTGTRRTKRTRRGTRNAQDPSGNDPAEPIAGLGEAVPQYSLDSLYLRKRLLGLLSRVSEQLPRDFVQISELYHWIIENVRHMPFPAFQAFISPYILPGLFEGSQKDLQSGEEHWPGEDGRSIRGQRSDAEQTTLCELLLFSILESAATQSNQAYLNQNKLEECFLPFAAANTNVVGNAKVSVLLEALMVLLAGNGMLVRRPSLELAVQNGIQHRAEKASQAKRQHELEFSWLIESGDRLLFLMELLQPEPELQVDQTT